MPGYMFNNYAEWKYECGLCGRFCKINEAVTPLLDLQVRGALKALRAPNEILGSYRATDLVSFPTAKVVGGTDIG